MSMTDPIADMLTRVRNANVAMHDTVAMPSSKLKVALAKVLVAEGYIVDYSTARAEKGPGEVLVLRLKYSVERDRALSGIRRISKPGLRIYARADGLPRVLGGLGVAVLSTRDRKSVV